MTGGAHYSREKLFRYFSQPMSERKETGILSHLAVCARCEFRARRAASAAGDAGWFAGDGTTPDYVPEQSPEAEAEIEALLNGAWAEFAAENAAVAVTPAPVGLAGRIWRALRRLPGVIGRLAGNPRYRWARIRLKFAPGKLESLDAFYPFLGAIFEKYCSAAERELIGAMGLDEFIAGMKYRSVDGMGVDASKAPLESNRIVAATQRIVMRRLAEPRTGTQELQSDWQRSLEKSGVAKAADIAKDFTPQLERLIALAAPRPKGQSGA